MSSKHFQRFLRGLLALGLGLALLAPIPAAALAPEAPEPTEPLSRRAPEPYETEDPPAPEDWEEDVPMRGTAIHPSLTPGVRNLVKRAAQITDVTWTAAADLEGWKAKPENKFRAGVTYTGVPYGQPHRSGAYVPWEAGFGDFLTASKNPAGPFYTQRAVSQVKQNEAPYYSCECSAFVSWAWGLESRQTTKTLDQYADYVGNQVELLQVGDILLKQGSHVRLVTDMTLDAQGKVTGVRISEEREPGAQAHWYRVTNQRQTLKALQEECLNQGYGIYRFPRRDAVSYTHSCAVPLAGDLCPLCGANPYRDVSLKSWYTQAVAFVNNQGIMTGTGADTFSPGKEIDRAMMVTVLWRLYHCPAGAKTPDFRDVKQGAYYYPALCWGVEKGIIRGAAPGIFSPKRPCTRAQTVTMLWRAAGSPKSGLNTLPFTDVKAGAYYYPALLWGVERGIVKGATSDRFAPDAMTSRAETAAMLQRFAQGGFAP